MGAAGKLASIALEELSKPGKVEGSSTRGAANSTSAPPPPRYTQVLYHLLLHVPACKMLHIVDCRIARVARVRCDSEV